MSCCICASVYNLYKSQDCRNRITGWGDEKHIFCFYCCMKYNVGDKDLSWMHNIKIGCPKCGNGIFMLEHVNSGQTRNFDDLLKEVYLFKICSKTSNIERMQFIIKNSSRLEYDRMLGSPTKPNLKYLDMMIAARRRLIVSPQTFSECKSAVNYEMEWYTWSYPECANCMGERNLCQFVDKKHCNHVLCLHCLLSPNDIQDMIYCPVCNEVESELENLHTKEVIKFAQLKLVYKTAKFHSLKSQSVEECIVKLQIRYLEWGYKTNLHDQVLDRLKNQPSWYNEVCNLQTIEMSSYTYLDLPVDDIPVVNYNEDEQ